MSDKQRVLFLCTHNSARSQMAEGLLRARAGDRVEVHSAGTQATFVRPEAIAVMRELGIDISSHQSKTLERYLPERWNFVITVCDDANEACPFLPGMSVRDHWRLTDPSKATGSPDERLAVYRQVRDDLAARVEAFADAALAA